MTLVVEPFSLEAYQKDPSKLCDPKGHKAKSSRLMEGDNLAVVWDTDPVTKGIYDLNVPAEAECLRIGTEKHLLQTAVWVAKSGHYCVWTNFGEPPCTREAQEKSSAFSHWLEGSMHSVLSAEGGKFGAPTTLIQHYDSQEDMLKVPRAGMVKNWRQILKHNPAATLGTSNVLWFFGGSAETLGARIAAGHVPNPIATPKAPLKKTYRRWRLADVAKFESKFCSNTIGT